MTCIRFKASTGPRRAFICVDDETLHVPFPDCPNADQHTPQPSGYTALSEWAGNMLETHDQEPCPGCGRLVIWKPLPLAAVAGATPTHTTRKDQP